MLWPGKQASSVFLRALWLGCSSTQDSTRMGPRAKTPGTQLTGWSAARSNAHQPTLSRWQKMHELTLARSGECGR